MKQEIKEVLQVIDEEVNKPLYDDLSDYLRGIRDVLNILYNRDYIDIEESKEYILEQISKIVVR